MQDKIKKTRSMKDLIISLVLTVAGAAMCFSSDSTLVICGVLLAISGVVAFFALKTSFKIEGDDVIYQRKTINLPSLRLDFTESFLKGETRQFEYIPGNGLMLYVYLSSDNRQGYAQLYTFVDYNWKEHGELVSLNEDQISQLMNI